MTLRRLPAVCLATVLAFAVSAQAPRRSAFDLPRFDLEEATIAELQQRMQTGQETARSLAEKYLARIAAVDRA
jgi:amidase